MDSGSGVGPKSEINVTPLVDVVLVLLIIFMVVVPVARMGQEAAIPPLASATGGPVPAQLVVRLAADGGVFFNSERIEPGSLAAALRQVLRGREKEPTFIAAADTVPYQKVIALMDACRQAGAENLAIVVTELAER